MSVGNDTVVQMFIKEKSFNFACQAILPTASLWDFLLIFVKSYYYLMIRQTVTRKSRSTDVDINISETLLKLLALTDTNI